MAGKRLARSKTIDTVPKENVKENQPTNTKTRSKNFCSFENESLLKTCDQFHSIINKNSNRTADIKQKTKAWITIKHEFDLLCKSNGLFVSVIFSLHCIVLVQINMVQFELIRKCCTPIIITMPVVF